MRQRWLAGIWVGHLEFGGALEVSFVEMKTGGVVHVLADLPVKRAGDALLELRERKDIIWYPEPHVVRAHVCVQFELLIRNEKLELHTHMRANDVWLGVPYDVFAFTQLQQSVARALHRQVGQYVHHATSLHLYERDLERAAKLQMTDPDAGEPPLPHGIRYRHGDFPSDWLPIRALASNILHGEFSTDLNGW